MTDTVNDDLTARAWSEASELHKGRTLGDREWFAIGLEWAQERARQENEAATFWAGVHTPDGMTAAQVKAELTDFNFMLGEVPKVYMEVTGGRLSKPNYHASAVIGVFNDMLDEMVSERVTEELVDQGHGLPADIRVGESMDAYRARTSTRVR